MASLILFKHLMLQKDGGGDLANYYKIYYPYIDIL